MRRLIIGLLLLLLSGCSGRSLATPTPVALRIAGSTSMGPALRELAAAFQAQQPHVLVDVRGGGSGAGIEEVRRSSAELAAVSWLAPGATAPAGLNATPIARDAIAVIVHAQNPIRNLTLLQLRALYRGETLDWTGLGGTAGEPVLVSREEGSGTRAAFEALVMGGERVTLNAIVMPNTATVVDYVAQHREAIGYVNVAALESRIRAVHIEDIAPSDATGAYHLTRTLYLYMPVQPTAEARAFVDFALSPAGQAITARHTSVR